MQTALAPIDWTKEQIKLRLETDDWWVSRAVVAIFNKQTEQEKSSEQTTEHNKVGFSAFDATILTSFAKQILKWDREENSKYSFPLSPKQLVMARKKIVKYAGQLAKIANKEI